MTPFLTLLGPARPAHSSAKSSFYPATVSCATDDAPCGCCPRIRHNQYLEAMASSSPTICLLAPYQHNIAISLHFHCVCKEPPSFFPAHLLSLLCLHILFRRCIPRAEIDVYVVCTSFPCSISITMARSRLPNRILNFYCTIIRFIQTQWPDLLSQIQPCPVYIQG